MLSLHSPSSQSSRPNMRPRAPGLMTEGTRDSVTYLKAGVNDQVNLLLMDVCESIQLPELARETAVKAYESIANFLMDRVQPTLGRPAEAYPQGSIRQQTTVKPLRRDVFDLDLVLELPWEPNDPVAFLRDTHAIVARWQAKDGAEFGAKPPEMRQRCIEICFDGQIFSMDVVPACYAGALSAPTRIKIVDAGRNGWKPSDPKALAEWFEERTKVREMILKEAAAFARSGSVEPVEKEDAAIDKPALRLAVQLAKRARDIYHQREGESADQAVPSILLTVLVARTYRGTQNLAAALLDAARDLSAFAASELPDQLENPANRGESITDKWERDPESWEAFRRWAKDFQTRVAALLTASDVPALHRALTGLFGEKASVDAAKLAAKRVGSALQDRRQSISPTGVVWDPRRALAGGVVASPTTYFGA